MNDTIGVSPHHPLLQNTTEFIKENECSFAYNKFAYKTSKKSLFHNSEYRDKWNTCKSTENSWNQFHVTHAWWNKVQTVSFLWTVAIFICCQYLSRIYIFLVYFCYCCSRQTLKLLSFQILSVPFFCFQSFIQSVKFCQHPMVDTATLLLYLSCLSHMHHLFLYVEEEKLFSILLSLIFITYHSNKSCCIYQSI